MSAVAFHDASLVSPRVADLATHTMAEPKLDQIAHLPGTEGWPIVGSTFAMLAEAKGEVERRAKRFGPVFRTRAFATAAAPAPAAQKARKAK
jgi:hypothetical protein